MDTDQPTVLTSSSVEKPRVKSKPPARRVTADSFVVTAGEEKYYPHVGEWVEFVPVLQLDTLLTAMVLQALQGIDMSDVTPDEAREVRTAFESVTRDMAKAIVRWNWTDNDDKPFPEKPGEDDLRLLSLEELMWLVGASFGTPMGEAEDRGEDSSG